MGKARQIRIATRVFEKAGDATQYFSSMLNRYSIGDIVNFHDSQDLTALLERHEEREEKIGVGIDHFEVRAAPDGYIGQCFWIARKDKTFIDFSYQHCLKRKPYD